MPPPDRDQRLLDARLPNRTIEVMAGQPPILDRVLPYCDAVLAEHLTVDAAPATTYRAAHDLDLLTVHSPVLDTAMWLRALPGRVAGRFTAPLPRLVVGDGVGLPGWVLLGEQPGCEIVFGAVGRFWQPVIEWRDVPAAEFTGFDEPGWGKIAANFSVRPYGYATLLSYECRTVTTDADSRRRFLRYWRLVRPFVAHIMRATLRTIRDNAR